jgi:diguanylate cyclase (GGDEF)-like protein
MSNLFIASRGALLTAVLLGFVVSLLLAAEFDLVSVSKPVGNGNPIQRLELQELLALSGIFSLLLAGVAWLNGSAAVVDRRARKMIEHTAYIDPLTGLANRRLFNQRFSATLARSRQEQSSCALLLIDLDRFKLVNDTLGHVAGDRLLVVVGDRIRAFAMVPEDTARLGGDEFAIILRNDAANEIEARALVARLERAIRRPVFHNGHAIIPGASIGVAFLTEETARASDLLEHADRDMYRVKELHQKRISA